MRSLIAVLVAVAALAVWGADAGSRECERCILARDVHGWCDGCGRGFVADVELRSLYLWSVLDAHGHDLDVARFGCRDCERANEADGFCERSNVGFVGGKVYFSRLTWRLASSRLRDDGAVRCAVCGDGTRREGWCATCSRGWVGRRGIEGEDAYRDLRREIEILRLAAAAESRCEHCAAAIVTDTECPVCRVSYRNGRARP